MSTVPQDFLENLANLSKVQGELTALKQVVADQKVYIVTVPRTGGPSTLSFDSVSAAAAYLMGLLNQEVQVFVFHGHRLNVTRGPHRFLIGPGELRVPLFHADPAEQDVDDEGWLIDAPNESLPLTPEAHTPPVLIPLSPT